MLKLQGGRFHYRMRDAQSILKNPEGRLPNNPRLTLLLFCCCAPSALLGQPTTLINLPNVGDKTQVTVPDPFFDCTLTIGVLNTNPAVASITPPGPTVNVPTGQDQVFGFTALQLGATRITLNTTGVGGRGQACGFQTGIFDVTVGPNTTVLPTEQQVIFTGFNGDPVSTATGELYDAGFAPDLSLGGPLPLQFSRYYASLINANGFVTLIGNNWMHNFNYRLIISGTTATVSLFGGKKIAFQASGNNWQLANPDLVGYQLANGPGTNRQFMDPASNLIYTFDSSGILIKIEDRNGNALTVAPPVNGTASVTDGLGRSLTFSYGTNGKLAKVQDQTGRSVSFGYTGNDLTQVTDANGKVETYAYTTAGTLVGLLTAKTLPLGNKPFNQLWDATGKVTKQSDSRGNATTYAYDAAGVAPTVITDPLGASQQQVHTGFKNETSYTDANGNTMFIGYDSNGHRTSVTDRLGDKITATYHSPSGYPASVTDALGNTTTYTYTAQTQGSFTFYVPTKIQSADGTAVNIVYDSSGNATSVTDQAGKITKATYNSRGQTLTATNATGGVTTFTYNSDATVATVTDSSGNVTAFTYDDKKRPAQIKYADGSTVSYVYDNRDNVLKVTNELGKVVSAAYDDNNRLKSVTDPLAHAAGVQYDNDERVTTATDFAGKSTNFTYNENGLLKSKTNPAGDSFSFAYDKVLRPISALDSSGKGFSFTYDKEDVLASVTDALSRTSTFTTDKLGRTTQVTTPLGENYKTTYDKRGGITSGTDPLGNTVQLGYDARELLTSVSLPLAISATYARTDLGLIGSITDPNGNVWNRSLDSSGRLTATTDPLGRRNSATYDSRNRVSGAQSPEASVSFTYDAAGNLTRQLYSAGSAAGPDLNFAYDDNNRLLSGPGFNFTYDANGSLTSSNGIAIARDDDSRISSITYSTGKSVKYAYDARGLLVSVTDWLGGVTTLVYDDAHQLLSIARPNGTNTKFSYDRDGRLSGIVESTGSSIALQRDAAGKETSANRTLPQAALPAAGVLPLAYDAAHQISGAKYDGLGRLLNDAMRTYTWDAASRLSSYSGADGASTSTYDGLGLRISRSSSGATQNYVLNYALGLPSISTVQDGSNKDQRYYVHLPDGTILYSVEAADNSRRFFHFDEVGSTTFLTNDSGAITDSYGITPYGESVTPGASNATSNPFTWLGAYGVMQEGATSLYYMRARWYDSSTARFLSRDPISSLAPQKINPYQYVEANPISSVDPLGLDDFKPFIAFTNVSSNPCQLGLSSTLIPTQIVGFVGVTGGQFFTINNPQQTVAFIQPGLIVGGNNTNLQQCNNLNVGGGGVGGNFFAGESIGISVTNANVREGFASSFKRRNHIPGYLYNPALFTATPGVGLADFGTRVRLTFNNVGTGTRTLVPVGGDLVFTLLNGGGRSAPAKLLAIQPPAVNPIQFGPGVSTPLQFGPIRSEGIKELVGDLIVGNDPWFPVPLLPASGGLTMLTSPGGR